MIQSARAAARRGTFCSELQSLVQGTLGPPEGLRHSV